MLGFCCCEGTGVGNPCIACISGTARAQYSVTVPSFFNPSIPLCPIDNCGAAAGTYVLIQDGIQWCNWVYDYPVIGNDCGPFNLVFSILTAGSFVTARFVIGWQIGGIGGPQHIWELDITGNPINCNQVFTLPYLTATSGVPCDPVSPLASITITPI